MSQDKNKLVNTHNPNRSHSSHCADDGWNRTKFTSLHKNDTQLLWSCTGNNKKMDGWIDRF